MDRKTIKELYANIDACSYVTKGESDSREVHSNFKVVCGLNLQILTKEFEEYAEVCKAKYNEVVSSDYAVFCDLLEKIPDGKAGDKREVKLVERFKDAIVTHDVYEKWVNEVFYLEQIKVPALKLWPFKDMPDKVAGGYMLAIKEMVADFPEFD